jgi:hypothetical protein
MSDIDHQTPFEVTSTILGYPITNGPPTFEQTVIYDPVTKQFVFKSPADAQIGAVSLTDFNQIVAIDNINSALCKCQSQINGHIQSITASSSSVTLSTVYSKQIVLITGTGTLTLLLPNTTLMPIGSTMFIVNNSTNVTPVQIQNNTGSAVLALNQNSSCMIILTNNSTPGGVWVVISKYP